MPPPEKRIEYLIKRQDTIGVFEKLRSQKSPVILEDMEGGYGIGKTTMLSCLYEILRQRSDVCQAWANLENFGLPPEPVTSDLAQRNIWLVQAQLAYKRLLIALGKELHVDRGEGADMESELDRLYGEPMQKLRDQYHITVRGGDINIGLWGRVSDSDLRAGNATAAGAIPSEDIEMVILEARNLITTAFGTRVNRLAQTKNVFIYLDNFCHIQNTQLEDWILNELVPKLLNCKFVIGRTDCDHELTHARDLRVPLPIHNFTPEESSEYVSACLGPEVLSTNWNEAVYNYCKGNPLFTALLVDIIKSRNLHKASNPGAWDLLRNMPRDDERKANELSRELIETMRRQNKIMDRVIDSACILREFDSEALESVVFTAPQKDFEVAFDLLRRLPVVEKIGHRYSMHEFFVRIRENYLADTSPKYRIELHRRAAAYYGNLLNKLEDETNERMVWERWHRYEQPEWQELSHSWLYHLGQTPDAGLEIATRYFDAFFWWGEYIPFPYCERLIADLDQAELQSKSRKWVDLLHSFHHTYPPTRLRTKDASWTSSTRNILGEMKQLAGLSTIPVDDAERWHLKALMDNYLAETHRFDDPHKLEAANSYKRSIQALREAEAVYRRHYAQEATINENMQQTLQAHANDELWCRAWMKIWLAGLYAERGDYAQALETLDEKEPEGDAPVEDMIREVDSEDVEALGRIHLTRAEACWGQANLPKAQTEYALYALYALGFLVNDNDFYSLEFLREMVERIANRFTEIQKRDPALLAVWWSSLVEFWGPEAGKILPSDLAQPCTNIDQCVQYDEFGKLLKHQLPLPEIPLRDASNIENKYKWDEKLSLYLDPDYSARASDAYNALVERLIETIGT